MNTDQKHESLVIEYQESTQTVGGFKKYDFAFQVGIWTILFCLKHFEIQHLYLYAAISFGLLLLSRVRDFKLRRDLDEKMTMITLEGIKLEKQNPRLESFFQPALRNFGIIRVLLQRSLFDLGALTFFALAVIKLILETHPNFMLDTRVMYPVLSLLGFFLSQLYTRPFKPLAQVKKELPST
jgi:hypothetical protein